MIQFSCSNCQAVFQVPDGQAGVRGVCKRCGHSIQAPRGTVGRKPLPEAESVVKESIDALRRLSQNRSVSTWILALGIPGAVIFLCCTCVAVVMSMNRGGAPDAAGDSNPLAILIRNKPVTRPKVWKIGDEVRFGDVGHTVNFAHTTPYSLMSLAGIQTDYGPHFLVQMTVKNYDSARIMEVVSQMDVARASDDVGNNYRPIRTFGVIIAGNKVYEQLPYGIERPVRSDEPFEEMLIFDRPVPAAKLLRLTLKAARNDRSETATFEIPIE